MQIQVAIEERMLLVLFVMVLTLLCVVCLSFLVCLSSHVQTFSIQSRVHAEAEQHGDATTPQHSFDIIDKRQ